MSLLNIHIVLSVITSTSAFVSNRSALKSNSIEGRLSFLASPSGAGNVPFRRSIGEDAETRSSLSAVIYGWDGEDEGMSAVDETISYGLESTCAGAAASPTAVALAESLSYDGNRMGSLARLAVAFSPPERALTLNDIENIQVLCVNEDSIEIEAIICEDGGCVSLAVPVSFPQACGPEWLEGCVFRNLDELEAEANSRIQVMDAEAALDENDLEELCLLNSKVEYPSWWIPPECDADLVYECETIQRLLNDGEFQGNVIALARNSLSAQGDGDGYDVKKAMVAAVGPAGLCLKVQAVYMYDVNQPVYTLDVLVPFGGEPKQNAESLRAAVLGAVMAAEN